jgi:hypothetical protein
MVITLYILIGAVICLVLLIACFVCLERYGETLFIHLHILKDLPAGKPANTLAENARAVYEHEYHTYKPDSEVNGLSQLREKAANQVKEQ